MTNKNVFEPSSLFSRIKQKLEAFWLSKRTGGVGRTKFVRDLADRMLQLADHDNIEKNFFIVVGEPGMGKSTVAALLRGQFTTDDNQPKPTLISYAFSLSHSDINSIGDFAEYVCGCLQEKFGIDVARHLDPEARLKAALSAAVEASTAEESGRIYLLIDGLEEFDGHRDLINILPRNDGIMYLLFTQPNVVQVDDGHNFSRDRKMLPHLTIAKARQILQDRLKDKREAAKDIVERLIGDEENRVPLLLTEFAEEFREQPERARALWEGISGLKMYFSRRVEEFVKYDIESNGATCKLLGALAHAKEHLPLSILRQFVANVNGITFKKSLNLASRFVISAQGGPEGPYEYRHNAWRTYAGEIFANFGKEFALWSGKKAHTAKAEDDLYSLRYGVRHLIDLEEWEQAAKLLMNFDYLMRRVATNKWEALFDEYEIVGQNIHESEFSDWLGFFWEKGHSLHLALKDWGPERILYQLAWEDGEDSAVSAAADEYKATWDRLLSSRPEHKFRHNCLSIPQVTGVIKLKNNKILSWYKSDLFLRDSLTGNCLAKYKGEAEDEIGGAVETSDGIILAYTNRRGKLIGWDSEKNESIAIPKSQVPVDNITNLRNDKLLFHGWGECIAIVTDYKKPLNFIRVGDKVGDIEDVIELEDGRLFVCRSDKLPCILTDSGYLDFEFQHYFDDTDDHIPPGDNQAVELKDGKVLTSGGLDAPHEYIWDPATRECWDSVDGLGTRQVVLSDGRILTFGVSLEILTSYDSDDDKTVYLEGHKASVNGAIELTDGKILSWSDDRTLRIWDVENGNCLMTHREHGRAVFGAKELSDGHIMWLAGGHLRIWDTVNNDKHALNVESKRPKPSPKAPATNDSVAEDMELMENMFKETPEPLLWEKFHAGESLTVDEYKCIMAGMIELTNGRMLSWPFGYEPKRELYVLDAASGKKLLIFAGHKDEVRGALLLNEKEVLSWSSDGALHVWNFMSGNLTKSLEAHNDAIHHALLVNGNKLVAECKGDNICIWDINSGKCISKNKIEGFYVQPLKDGRILICSPSFISLWDRSAEKKLAALYVDDIPDINNSEFPLSAEYNGKTNTINFIPASPARGNYGR